MGVRVRLSRNSSMYVPFVVAIPVYLLWVCAVIIWAVIMLVFYVCKYTCLGISSLAHNIAQRHKQTTDQVEARYGAQ